tara:strand:+ start:299 stop:622 length:324 start_codon:yes stop_codon:yes gene_type:complete
MITEADYTFIENPSHPLHGVKYLSGDFKDVTVIYGTVKIKESPELGYASLGFTFQILDPADYTVDELNESESFKDYMGRVLQHIIENNLEDMKIGTATNTHTESPSQ